MQKLLNYFNSTTVSTSYVLAASAVYLVALALNLYDSESVMLSTESSLWYCHKLSDVFE